jgi:hypothetical protein
VIPEEACDEREWIGAIRKIRWPRVFMTLHPPRVPSPSKPCCLRQSGTSGVAVWPAKTGATSTFCASFDPLKKAMPIAAAQFVTTISAERHGAGRSEHRGQASLDHRRRQADPDRGTSRIITCHALEARVRDGAATPS